MTINKLTLFFLLFTLPLAGCAKSQYGPQITTVKHYPACYQPIQNLRDAESDATSSAVGGAVLGGIAGGLIGGLATGKWTGALIGAGAGAVSGGLLGYAKSKQDSITDARARYASYVGDISSASKDLDRVTLASKAASACYQQQFERLVAQYKNKEISQPEYRERYAEIKSGLQEAANILGTAYNQSVENDKAFEAALTDEAQKAGTSVDSIKKRSGTKKKTGQKVIVAKTPAPTDQQPQQQADSQRLAGLDEGSLDAVYAETEIHALAIDDAKEQQLALNKQIQEMDALNMTFTSEELI